MVLKVIGDGIPRFNHLVEVDERGNIAFVAKTLCGRDAAYYGEDKESPICHECLQEKRKNNAN